MFPIVIKNQTQLQTLSPSSTEVKAGCYEATTLDSVDTDLIPDNIKEGITIFGVAGTYTKPTCFDKAPKEQLDTAKVATTIYSSPPAGYNAVMGWAQALIGESKYGTTGKVIIENLSLWEVKNGQHTLVTDQIVNYNTVWGYTLEKSDWYTVPSKWVCPPEPQSCGLTTADGVIVTSEGYVELNVSTNPSKIYHFWNTEWPRPLADIGATYYVKANIQTTGNAMLQIGIDFWTETDSGTNIEAAYSNWACDTDGEWQEVKAGAEP